MFNMKFFTFILFEIILKCVDADDYCYADDPSPYVLYSSKTAYELTHGITVQKVPYCEPVFIWMLTRHGTRYPGKDEIQNMRKLIPLRDEILHNHEDGRGDLCEKDLNSLRRWNYNLSEDHGGELTNQGREDLKFIGKRLKVNFPSIFNETYEPSKFIFRTTYKQRTEESMKVLASELFGHVAAHNVEKGTKKDTLLYTFGNCPAWEIQDDSPEISKEEDLFEATSYMNMLIHDVSQRLGFLFDLKIGIIQMMYDMCRYEKAWTLSSKPAFCSAFTKDELMILEYYQDLHYYYHNGYGSDMNVKLVCPLIRDMMARLSSAVADDGTGLKGVFYASHTQILVPMIAKLGMFHDRTPLTHDIYATASKREWRSSYIDPFATNIAAVLYKCSKGEKYSIIFYQNEKVYNNYPNCSVGLCSWEYIKSKFQPDMDCNIEFCNSNNDATILSFTYHILWNPVLLFIFYDCFM